MFPSEGTEQFYIKVVAPVGSSMERTSAEVRKIETVLLEMKNKTGEILSFSTRIGHLATGGASRTSGDHENWAILTVYLTQSGERSRTARQIIDAIRAQTLLGYGTRTFFEERRMGPPLGRPAEIVVLGNNAEAREKTAARIIAFLLIIPGVRDVDRDDKEGKRQLVIEPDYTKLAAYGLTTKDVADLIRGAFDGRRVTSLQTLESEIWYRVILAPEFRKGVASLAISRSGTRPAILFRWTSWSGSARRPPSRRCTIMMAPKRSPSPPSWTLKKYLLWRWNGGSGPVCLTKQRCLEMCGCS